MNKDIKIFLKNFGMVVVTFLVVFSFMGCQEEEPDGLKIQKSNNGISISGKYGDKSIDIEKSNKSDKEISINGKSGDSSFSFENSDSSKESKIKEFIKDKIIPFIAIVLILGGPILIAFLMERSLRKKNNKTMIESSIANLERYEKNKYDNEAYNQKLSENKIICNYKEKSLELSKIYNLYKNEIYSEHEYKSKKEKWIESLKILNFNTIEVDFLNEIIEFVNDGIIENKELELIKYIVSGEYSKDKYIEQQEQKIKAEEQARKKREEVINNIKDTTKEITIGTISKTVNTVNEIKSIVSTNFNKRVAPNNQFACECGYAVEEEDAFCTNCGKKLN